MSTEIKRQDHPSKRQWTAEEIELLGREPDAQIARELKIAVSTVAAERRRRDIPPYRKRFEWTEEALALLGTDSDRRIAEILGVSSSLVGKKRRDLGIEACYPTTNIRRRPDPFWTPEREALLGTASDAEIGRRLGIPYYRVTTRRRRLGIPSACPIPRHDWTDIDPLLGCEPDAAVAARFGMHEETARRRRLKLKIPPYRPERRTIRRDDSLRSLLECPTAEISEISSSAAVMLRQELGLPPPPRRSCWTPEHLRRLGQEPDEVIARELGISPHTVRMKRYALGISKRPWRPWTPDEIAILSQYPDNQEAARRLDRSVKAIRHMRSRLKRLREEDE